MITKLPESNENILGFKVEGKVSLEQEKELISHIESALEDHEKVGVLVMLCDKATWGIDAGYEDLKWAMKHMHSFHRIAIVSDRKTWEWLVAMESPFMALFGIGEKHFDMANLEKAWKWIQE